MLNVDELLDLYRALDVQRILAVWCIDRPVDVAIHALRLGVTIGALGPSLGDPPIYEWYNCYYSEGDPEPPVGRLPGVYLQMRYPPHLKIAEL